MTWASFQASSSAVPSMVSGPSARRRHGDERREEDESGGGADQQVALETAAAGAHGLAFRAAWDVRGGPGFYPPRRGAESLPESPVLPADPGRCLGLLGRPHERA